MKSDHEVCNKLRPKMSVPQMMFIMTDGKPDASYVIMRLLQRDPQHGMQQIWICDEFGIYGEKLIKLLDKACASDLEMFYETLKAFKAGRYTKEQIHRRLDQENPRQFV